jgi:hypothetical protein
MAYTTSKDAAWFISLALNRFANSEEGKSWLKKHK